VKKKFYSTNENAEQQVKIISNSKRHAI